MRKPERTKKMSTPRSPPPNPATPGMKSQGAAVSGDGPDPIESTDVGPRQAGLGSPAAGTGTMVEAAVDGRTSVRAMGQS